MKLFEMFGDLLLNDNVTVTLNRVDKNFQEFVKQNSEVETEITATDEATPTINKVDENLDKIPEETSTDIKVEDKTEAPIEKIRENFQKLSKEIGEKMSKAGKTMSVAVTAPLTAIAGLMVKTASDAEETQAKFDTAFKGITKSAEDAAQALSVGYNMSSLEAKRLLSGTGDLLKGFGFTADAALELSNNVQEIAADLASYNNLQGGTTRASEILTKAMLGERDALTSLGIKISEEDVKQRLFEKGQQDLTGQTLLAAKAQATYELVLQQSGDALGDMARTSQSFANQSRALKGDITDLSASFGKQLLPIATEIVGKVRQLIDWFSDLTSTQKKVILSVGAVVAAIGPLLLIAGKLMTAVAALTPVFAAVGTAIAGVTAPVWATIAAITALVAGIAIWISKSEDAQKAISKAFDIMVTTIKNFVGDSLIFLGNMLKGIALFISNNDEYFKNLEKIISNTFEIISDVIKIVWDNIKQWTNEAFQFILKIWESNAVQLAVKKVTELIEYYFEKMSKFVTLVFENLQSAMLVIKKLLEGDFAGAWKEANKILEKTYEFWKEIFDDIIDLFVNIGTNIINAIKTETPKIIENFKEFGENIIIGLADGIMSKFNDVKETIGNVAQGISDAFTDFFSIKSPSRLMKEYGGFLVEGLSLGMKDETPNAEAQAEDTGQKIADGVTGKLAEGMDKTGDDFIEWGTNLKRTGEEVAMVTKTVIDEVTGEIKEVVVEAKQTYEDTIDEMVLGGFKYVDETAKQAQDMIQIQKDRYAEWEDSDTEYVHHTETTWSKISSYITDNMSKVKDLVIAGLTEIIGISDETAAGIGAGFDLATQVMAGDWIGAATTIITKGDEMFNALNTMLRGHSRTHEEIIADTIKAWEDFSNSLEGIVKETLEPITETLYEVAKNVGNAIADEYNAIAQNNQEIINNIYQIGKASAEQMAEITSEFEGEGQTAKLTGNEIARMIEDISNNMIEGLEIAIQSGEGIMEQLNNAYQELSAIAIQYGVDLTESMSEIVNAMTDIAITEADRLGDAIMSALKKKREAERDAELSDLDDKIARAENARDAELAILDDKYNKKLESLGEFHQNELDEIEDNRKEEIDRLKDELEEKKTIITRAYENEITELKRTHEDRQDELKNNADEEIDIINDTLEGRLTTIKRSYEDEIDELKRTHEDRQDELKDNAEYEIDIINDTLEDRLNTIKKSYEDEIDELNDAYDERIDIINTSYDEEIAGLNEVLNEKKAMYDEDLMNKIASINAESAESIKAYQDEINAIKAAAEAEKETREVAAQEAKQLELEKNIELAETAQELAEAKQELAEFLAKIEQERIEKERELAIQEIEDKIEIAKNSAKELIEQAEKENEDLKSTEEKNTEDMILEVKKRRDSSLEIEKEAHEKLLTQKKIDNENLLNEEKDFAERKINIIKDNLNKRLEKEKEAHEKLLTQKKRDNEDLINEEKDLAEGKINIIKDNLDEILTTTKRAHEDLLTEKKRDNEDLLNAESDLTDGYIDASNARYDQAVIDENKLSELRIDAAEKAHTKERSDAETALQEKVNNLQDIRDETAKHYEALLTEQSLQNEALRLAQDEDQSEMISLLEKYEPLWQDKGQSFGDKLLNGLNSMKQPIQSAVSEILGMVDAAQEAEAELYGSTAASGALPTYGEQTATFSTTPPVMTPPVSNGTSGNTTINQNVTFVDKNPDPFEVARLLKRESQALAAGVI